MNKGAVKIMVGMLTETTNKHIGTLDRHLESQHGPELGPWHMDDSYVAWSFVGLTGVEPEPVSDT